MASGPFIQIRHLFRVWIPVINNQVFRFLLAFVLVAVSARVLAAGFDSEYEEKQWEEIEAQLPDFPKPENLDSFYVSATTDNKFMIDRDSISIGADGVIRYTLVVLSASGAQNVSYDGLRCATGERRLYAFGRADKKWSKARSNQWTKIRESTLNRHHAALYFEYFCPDGIIARDAEEARLALRSGGHPSKKRR
jgi:hypothetical protein